MKTLDLKKDLKYLYGPSAKKVEIVQVPCLQFAMIDGAIEKGYGPGNSPSFQEATQALYGISYTLKFMLKKRKSNAIDYPVMALEGLWWVEDGVFDITIQDNWFYTLMILQPDVITNDLFEEGRKKSAKNVGIPCPVKVVPAEFRRRALHADNAHRSLRNRTRHRGPDESLRVGKWISGQRWSERQAS